MPETTQVGPANLNYDWQVSEEDAARFAAALQQAGEENRSRDAGAGNQPDEWTQNLNDFQALADGQGEQYVDALVQADEQEVAAQPAAQQPGATPGLGTEDPHPLHPLGSGARRAHDLLRDPADRTMGAKAFRGNILRAMGETGGGATPNSTAVFNGMRNIGRVTAPLQLAYGAYAAYDDIANAPDGKKLEAGFRSAGRVGGGWFGSQAGLAGGSALLAGGAVLLGATPPGWLAIGVGVTSTAVGAVIGGRLGGRLGEDLYHFPELAQDTIDDIDHSIRDLYDDTAPGADGPPPEEAFDPQDQWGSLLGVPDSWPAPASEATPAPVPSPAPEPTAAPTPSPAAPTGGIDVGPAAPVAPEPQEPEVPTQAGPAPGSPAAPAPQTQPSGGETTDAGETFVGDIIKISENEMREWTPADSKPAAPDSDDDDDDDDGAPAPGSDTGGSSMPNPEGDPAPGTGPTYPVYTSNGAGAIRPAPDEIAEPTGTGLIYPNYNGPAGAVRPADGGPVFDVDNFDFSGINVPNYNGPAGAIRPGEVEEPAPRGGTLVSPLGPDPTIALDTEALTASLGRLGLG